MALVTLGWALAAPGCSESSILGKLPCSDTEACPEGLTCIDGSCVERADGGDMGLADADAGEVVAEVVEDPGMEAETAEIVADVPDVSDVADTVEVIDTADAADTEPEGKYKDPCETDEDCQSGLCIEGPEGGVCSKSCENDSDCGGGWECLARGGDLEAFVCYPDNPLMCAGCESDDDCFVAGDGCLELPDGRACGQECSIRPCPNDYECQTVVTVGGVESPQCVPVTGVCVDCFDPDGDDYGLGGGCFGPDCAEGDAAVYPGAPELCDGLDNDCDGQTDGVTMDCYSGPFGTEGEGICAGGTTTCTAGEWGDCEGQTLPTDEICDSFDNDCDGVVDAITEACYTGLPGSEKLGVCKAGERTCNGGLWSSCEGQVRPEAETCDGLDNDCDGLIDDETGELSCGTGVCAKTVPACIAGVEQTCDPEEGAVQEYCDGLDNDCDGQTDEELGEIPCGLGACERVLPVCEGGAPVACDPFEGAGPESCDGSDDDCDGLIDEGLGEIACGQGVCARSMPACEGGAPAVCDPLEGAAAEVCDGADNDCDGQIDEELGQQTCGLGACQNTVPVCDGGVPQTCNPFAGSSAELCDGIDNDCNGVVDDDCLCLDGETQPCYSGDPADLAPGTACLQGEQTCQGGAWGPCVGEQAPAPEACDGADNDCDGLTDEDLGQTSCGQGICAKTVDNCAGGAPQACAPFAGAEPETCNGEDDDCDGLVDEDLGQTTCGFGVCVAAVDNCVGGEPQVCAPLPIAAPEECDGLDNDCDGLVDTYAEGCYEGADGTAGVGSCREGTRICKGAVWGGCLGQVLPMEELCGDGADNDCNGQVDDGCVCADGDTQGCYTGDPDTLGLGLCAEGTQTCAANAWGLCEDETLPAPEACDGFDNDCNGLTDDGLGQTSCGLGECAHTVDNCDGGAPRVCDPLEGATPETCDGLDNNCDGATDEGCDCVDDTTEACYSGDPADLANAPCKAGTRLCTSGTWGACEGEVLPLPEDCDGADNDCDGLIDDGFGQVSCGIGACAVTIDECLAGVPRTCEPGTPAADDATCDGVDDDCDGATDEDFASTPTSCGVGACSATGATSCAGGTITDSCVPGAAAPDDATCDEVDDDCDGATDEDYPAGPTTCGVGACAATGAMSCVAGTEVDSCSPGAPAADDATCDGVDDDCDGTDDEDFSPAPTTCGVGACAATGATTCDGGVEVDSCTPGAPAADDATCDGVDDDCSGTADEDYLPTPTTCGVGACAATGQTTCSDGVEGDSCVPGMPAVGDATCDNIDDDCDGQTDEDCTVCAPFDPVASSVTATSACLTAATGARSAVVVRLVDDLGHLVYGAEVTMQATSGTLDPAFPTPINEDADDYWAVLTAPSLVPAGGTITIQVEAVSECDSATFQTSVQVAAPFTDPAGGAGGCSVDGNVRVRVVEEETGDPIEGAHVMLGGAEQAGIYEADFRQPPAAGNTAVTDADGYAVFRDFAASLEDRVTVTAAAGDPGGDISTTSRWYLTFVDMDASDLVLPLGLVVPPGTDTITGQVTGMTTSNRDVDAALVLTDLSIAQLANFRFTDLLAPSECVDFNITGMFCPQSGAQPFDMPGNAYLPQQQGNILFVCNVNIPQHPFSVEAKAGNRLLYALEADTPLGLNLLDLDMAGLIASLNIDRIGAVEPVVSSGTGQTISQNVGSSSNLARNITCNVPAGSGIPNGFDIFCISGFDFDAASAAELGNGRIGLAGFEMGTTKGDPGPYSMSNVQNIPNSGIFANKQRLVATAALVFEDGNCTTGAETDCPPAGTDKGVTAAIKRDAAVPVTGGVFAFPEFFNVRPLARTGRAYDIGAVTAGPGEHYAITTIEQRVREQNMLSCNPPEIIARTRDLWRVYTPPGSTTFDLPAVPAGWPRDYGVTPASGLLDTGASAEDDYLYWRSLTVHEGQSPSFSYDAIELKSFVPGITHTSVNQRGW